MKLYSQNWLQWIFVYALVSTLAWGHGLLNPIGLSGLLYFFGVFLKREFLRNGWAVLMIGSAQMVYLWMAGTYMHGSPWFSLLGWIALLILGGTVVGRAESRLQPGVPRYASEAFVPTALLLAYVMLGRSVSHPGFGEIALALVLHLAVLSWVIVRNSRAVVNTAIDPETQQRHEKLVIPTEGGLPGYAKAALLPSGVVGLIFIAFDMAILTVPVAWLVAARSGVIH